MNGTNGRRPGWTHPAPGSHREVLRFPVPGYECGPLQGPIRVPRHTPLQLFAEVGALAVTGLKPVAHHRTCRVDSGFDGQHREAHADVVDRYERARTGSPVCASPCGHRADHGHRSTPHPSFRAGRRRQLGRAGTPGSGAASSYQATHRPDGRRPGEAAHRGQRRNEPTPTDQNSVWYRREQPTPR